MNEIRPDIKSALLIQGAKTLSPVLAIIAGYAMLKVLGIAEMLSGLSSAFPGIKVAFKPFIAIIVIAVIAILSVLYLSTRNTRYVFLERGMLVYGGITSTGQGKEVPYSNISRVTMKTYPLLGVGKITLELSGMERQKMEMDFVKNPNETAQYIEGLRR